MSELVAFLVARLDEDEAVARAAIDPDRPGTHWQWVRCDDDVPVESPEWHDGDVSLRSVEEFPTTSGVGDLPAFVINHTEADEPRALPHIARFDPARVLAEVDAKRRIMETECAPYPEGHAPATVTLRLLALPYADAPGYREEWKP